MSIEPDMTVSPAGLLDPRIEGRILMRTDPHCHILPGLDDGSANLNMSLAMARRMIDVGIERVVATPHGAHPFIETYVHPDFVREQVQALQQHLDREGLELQVLPGTEVYIGRSVLDLYDAGELITWADQGKFILVELGFQEPCETMLDVIDGLMERGLTPIVAHPERYTWLPQQIGVFHELRERGCIFQFNMMSINGHFGPRLQALVLELMQHGDDFIIGSDSHSDAWKYFDFPAAKKALGLVGLVGPNDEILSGTKAGLPAI